MIYIIIILMAYVYLSSQKKRSNNNFNCTNYLVKRYIIIVTILKI